MQCEKEYWSDLRAGHWYIVLSGQDRDGTTQFDTFSESILEQGDKELRIRRVSGRFDQDQNSAETPEMWDCKHKSW